MSTKTKSRASMSEEERAERRAAEREQMREAVEALRTSEGWQRWLKVRRHFHTYSFHNQLMIAMQLGHATRVAGFRRWLEIGYCVRKGEKAIRIWRRARRRRSR
jgi:N-terminal domain of anti-restriction factor ArdC